MWSGSANTHDRLSFRCQSVVWFLTLWPGTVPSLVTRYLPETGTSCREGGERQIQDGGGNRFLDEPFELSGVQVRAPGVFPQLPKMAISSQLIDMNQINPTGRLSD